MISKGHSFVYYCPINSLMPESRKHNSIIIYFEWLLSVEEAVANACMYQCQV